MLAVLVLGGAVASAAPERTTLHRTRTFMLAAGKTRTFSLAYPDALKYGGSKYSGNVTRNPPPSCGPRKNPCPRRAKVHVLSKGSCDGGSDFCARVRNSNAVGTAAFAVRLTARTELPAGRQH